MTSPPSPPAIDLALHAIAEPHRRAIMRLVRDRELPAGEIAAHLPISAPAVSQHLRVLLDAGLVRVRRAGTHRLYRVRQEGLDDLRTFLDEFWDAGLEQLRLAAEAEERRLRDGER